MSRNGRNQAAVGPFVELTETLGARVMHDLCHMNIPGNHLLQRGYCGISPVPPDTDCVLVIDTLTPWATPDFHPGPGVRVIRIDVDPINRITPIYELPSDLSITADSAKAIPVLLEELRSLMTPEHERRCQARRERQQAEGRQRLDAAIERAQADRRRGIISPAWLSYQIGETLDPETMVVHELCDASLFNRSRPGTLIGTGGSSIGWAAPAPVGVKVAAPDRPVVAAVGDGSWMFGNPQVTVWASRFHKAPVLFIVFNNRGYRTGTDDVLRTYPEGYAAKTRDLTGGWFDPCPNYSGEAAASGAYGEQVTDPD